MCIILKKYEQQQCSVVLCIYCRHFLYYDANLKKYQNLHPAKYWSLKLRIINFHAFKHFNALDENNYVTTLESLYVRATDPSPSTHYILAYLLHTTPLCHLINNFHLYPKIEANPIFCFQIWAKLIIFYLSSFGQKEKNRPCDWIK